MAINEPIERRYLEWSQESYLVLTEKGYKVAFRKKLYRSIEEIQTDLDEFMTRYNTERTNQGRYCQGRTPLETFNDGLALYDQYVYDNLGGKEAA